MWYQSQSGLAISGDLSIQQGKIANGSGHQMMELNKLLSKAKTAAQVPLRVHAHQSPVFVTWTDSAWAVRADGKSQGAFVTS